MRLPSRARIYARYFRFLLGEFRTPLLVVVGLVVVGGFVLYLGYRDEPLSYAKACYAIFLLIFLNPIIEFPDEWYLQPLFFVLPVVGLSAVADSLARLIFLVFSKKHRLPEWQRMVASLYRDHTVVVGVGKVGYQIIRSLRELGEPVVAVQRVEPTESPLVGEVLEWGVPLIRGDVRTSRLLEEAGVREARAVLLVTSDDLTNLDAALTARDLNADARIVLRLFDESLAAKVRGAFALPAISTSYVAAPAFIAAATGRRVYQGFELAGRQLHLIDLTVRADGQLAGRDVGSVQAELEVNIVLRHGPEGPGVNPAHEVVLQPGDELLVIAPIERLRLLEARNEPAAPVEGRR